MPSWVWVLIAIGIVLVLALVAWNAYGTRRRKGLQDRFGPEYDRTVADAPSRREAESELSERQKRRDELDIRPLEPDSRDRYASRWHNTQAKFVDAPEDAVGEADTLIQEVMRERGYPVEDFEQQAADVSVDHPEVVEHYRKAHAIHTGSRASTEELREAMLHYRALFAELLEGPERETQEVR